MLVPLALRSCSQSSAPSAGPRRGGHLGARPLPDGSPDPRFPDSSPSLSFSTAHRSFMPGTDPVIPLRCGHPTPRCGAGPLSLTSLHDRVGAGRHAATGGSEDRTKAREMPAARPLRGRGQGCSGLTKGQDAVDRRVRCRGHQSRNAITGADTTGRNSKGTHAARGPSP